MRKMAKGVEVSRERKSVFSIHAREKRKKGLRVQREDNLLD